MWTRPSNTAGAQARDRASERYRANVDGIFLIELQRAEALERKQQSAEVKQQLVQEQAEAFERKAQRARLWADRNNKKTE